MKTRSRVAVIGAGPAGIAAALQLRRFGLDPIVFEQARIGGLLNNAYLIENYPGFPNGISGTRLVTRLQSHLRKWKVKVMKERVNNVIRNSNGFVIKANRRYRAEVLIVASGTVPKIPEMDINSIKGIFFEIYPIRHVKNKKIIIIGAGDTAFDYALTFAKNNQVTILNRGDRIKGLLLLHKVVQKYSSENRNKVRYYDNTSISSIEQLNNCSIVKVLKSGKKQMKLSCDYVVFAIGREPATGFLSPAIEATLPEGDGKGIHFVGDVRNGNLRQTAIAVGDGIKAAMRIYHYLKTQKTQKTRKERSNAVHLCNLGPASV